MGISLRVGGRTDAGRVRAKNEDAFIAADLTRSECSLSPRWSGLVDVGERGALVAVSDGMSAGRDGELASALVISSLAQGLERHAAMRTKGPASDAAAEAHDTAWAGACSWGLDMGATLTALYLRGGVRVPRRGRRRARVLDPRRAPRPTDQGPDVHADARPSRGGGSGRAIGAPLPGRHPSRDGAQAADRGVLQGRAPPRGLLAPLLGRAVQPGLRQRDPRR